MNDQPALTERPNYRLVNNIEFYKTAPKLIKINPKAQEQSSNNKFQQFQFKH